MLPLCHTHLSTSDCCCIISNIRTHTMLNLNLLWVILNEIVILWNWNMPVGNTYLNRFCKNGITKKWCLCKRLHHAKNLKKRRKCGATPYTRFGHLKIIQMLGVFSEEENMYMHILRCQEYWYQWKIEIWTFCQLKAFSFGRLFLHIHRHVPFQFITDCKIYPLCSNRLMVLWLA